MTDCGCQVENAQAAPERRAVTVALVLNATMFVVGATAGLIAHSSGLLADALDMLADSMAYAIALVAIGRSVRFKRGAATASGSILAILGAGVMIDTVRRAFGSDEPMGWIMIGSSTLSLIVNLIALRMLSAFREGEVHLRASWIFTRADVVANLGVITAAALVMSLGTRWPDTIIGLAIGSYVIKEALEILSQAREERGKSDADYTAG